jgi:1-acyl-sn-glycerol-3-phosphate acyltransferase
LKVYHRLSVSGRERLPSQPSYVLVANHASHLDALVLAASLPLNVRNQLFPLAAGDVFFQTPATSALSAIMMNALPVWRKHCGHHALASLRHRLLEAPSIFLLFPEGTRSRNGELGPFKPGIGMLVAETALPVFPCYLSGTYDACPPGALVPRPRKITLTIGEPRIFTDFPNCRSGWEQIATTLAEDVRRLASLR